MRTTLDIETPILEQLKKLQRSEKRSLSQIASALLAESLASRRRDGDRVVRPAFDWGISDMDSKVDLSDKDALYRAMEES